MVINCIIWFRTLTPYCMFWCLWRIRLPVCCASRNCTLWSQRTQHITAYYAGHVLNRLVFFWAKFVSTQKSCRQILTLFLTYSSYTILWNNQQFAFGLWGFFYLFKVLIFKRFSLVNTLINYKNLAKKKNIKNVQLNYSNTQFFFFYTYIQFIIFMSKYIFVIQLFYINIICDLKILLCAY